MSEIWSMTATEIRESVRHRKLSRVEVVKAHLGRIEKINSKVNALVELRTEQALEEARAADADHDARVDMPLDGVPFSIKDHFDVKGMKHTEGLPDLAEQRSTTDEDVIRRLKSAGAIIVGKANQPDIQIRWNTISNLYGETRNPRDLSCTAGGSSGGDAAAVAAGMAACGLGVDYGGSIRVPASFCEIYGLRPSAGRVAAVPTLPPFDGPPSLDFMSSTGPFARSVEDINLIYQVISGQNVQDPATVPVNLYFDEAKLKRPKIARMVDQTGAKVSPEIIARLEHTTDILKDAGYEVVDEAIPHAKRAPEVWAEIIGTELMETVLPPLLGQLGESNRVHIEELFGKYGLGRDVRRYIDAYTERRKIVREVAAWMETYPLVLCPVAGMPTPPIGFDSLIGKENTWALFDQMRNIPWVNLLSVPSLALPNGIQIVGRRFHEVDILRAATMVQDALGRATVAQL